MAFAVTGYKAYGVEGEEPLSSHCYQQFLTLDITALDTDIDMDLGSFEEGSLGTFWTEADGSAIGLAALKVLRQIVARAASFQYYGGLSEYSGSASPQLVVLEGTTAGGNAAEAVALSGLTSSDVIVSIRLFDDGPNNVTLAAATTGGVVAAGAGAATITFSGDPGAGAIVQVLVEKAAAPASSVAVAMKNMTPEFTFASGDAPEAISVTLCWNLQNGVAPLHSVG